ncbi:MAG TPA: protease pro-enzyme activation domain-containing protein [Verrucomicrobiae bacterium]|nr:protease pro-enzyme activation domain-containing protein [Verrucomicrobiae bacterium]
MPESARRLPPKSDLAATNRLNLAIGLPLRDAPGLENFLTQVSDPASPNYRQYLTPAEFTARFGPTEADYAAVQEFARRNHLRVTGLHEGRMVLDVEGATLDVENAFAIKMHVYRHDKEARDFFAPDHEPTVDAALPIADVSGLNNYTLPRPKNLRTDAQAAPLTGSGSNGAYLGQDFRHAYLPNVTLTGAGQMLGLLEFDGFYASDITSYETAAGLTPLPLQTILLDGFNGTPTTGANSGDPEVSLDIEVAAALAPGLSKIVVFEAGPRGLENDILTVMAESNQIKQLSCSWGWGGGPSATTDNIFKRMAAQGQSFFTAAGDSDAFTVGSSSVNGVDNPSLANAPASSPYITAVGGTTLTTTGPGGTWAGETVWNWGLMSGSYVGGSGGISSYYALPSWQSGISMAANGGSTNFRNIPDVAMTADNVYVVYNKGSIGAFGGTSCAAPLWAAFTALVNQQATASGRATAGFINPAIYALGKSSSYSSTFHDVTTGNNASSSSPNSYHASAGYDLCTGWGTPSGQGLIDALVGATNTVATTAQPIVQNGGFESDDLTGWTLTGNTVVYSRLGAPTIYNAVESATAGYNVVHSGSYGVFLGDNQLATLAQTVSTVAGQSYLISFWLDNPAAGSGQQFQATWNGVSLYGVANPPAFGWTNVQRIMTATSASSSLQFAAENVPGYFGLDDVSVTPIPTAAFATATTSNQSFTLTWPTLAGLTYQVQYSTDLTQPSWANLGAPVIATGSSLSISDPMDPSGAPQRFYRLAVAP